MRKIIVISTILLINFSNVPGGESISDWDKLYSSEPLGNRFENGNTIFSLFAPRATQIVLEIYDEPFTKLIISLNLQKGTSGIWSAELEGSYIGRYYGYRVWGPTGEDEQFNPDLLIPDPYSYAYVSRNEYQHRAMTLIINDNFDWEGDTWMNYDLRDLIIFEIHIRDLTADNSTGLPDSLRGTYLGLVAKGYRGGFSAIQELGVNAVELLPCQEFANIEIPYNIEIAGVTNSWNPYARNHWGYMTSNYFAPESYYATGEDITAGGICGEDGRAVKEFKQMVKAFHKAGIAVIMDVVYNHTSQYDYNSLKYIDKKYYYRLDEKNRYLSHSGCGNDFNTAHPMARRLIIDSLKRWVADYHIDGFRFDIAAMIDWATIDKIREVLREINPNVILIAEPWGGGGYWPEKFSLHDYSAWNDMFRNGVKGPYPYDDLGLIFGKKWQNTDFRNLILGSLVENGGLFQKAEHSINYLESHDDYTLGDFIRIACGKDTINLLAYQKLSALMLFCSQGAIMIAEGQEYGRSKVIAPTDCPDENVGRIDHNSYEKDNPTNWINYHIRNANSELVEFYRELIAFRKMAGDLKYGEADHYDFITGDGEFSEGFFYWHNGGGRAVLFNFNQEHKADFKLPRGGWKLRITTKESIKRGAKVQEKGYHYFWDSITLPPISGVVLDL
jgi:pullulanase/glycogen debranching enzyme